MSEVKQIPLFNLLSFAHKGELVIPDFQRDFIWSLKQIEELLNSILNGYFIGSILLLENETNSLRFAPRFLKGVNLFNNAIDTTEKIYYILDGQQRINSLYYSFYEPEEPLFIDGPKKFYLRPDTLEVFGLEDPEYISKRLKLTHEMKSRLYEIYHQMYGIELAKLPTMRVFLDEEKFNYYLSQVSNSNLKDTLIKIYNSLHNYTIPVIILDNETKDEDIVNIFERINRAGTPLNIFDLAVARYYPLGIRLNILKNEIQNEPFMEVLDEIAILKVMALLNEIEPNSKNLLKIIENDNPDKTKAISKFHELWNKSVKYLNLALQRIRHFYGGTIIRLGKKNLDLIPYTSLLIPLAILLYEIDKSGGSLQQYNKLDYWYWATVLNQRYTHGIDTKSFNDVKELKQWFFNDNLRPAIIINVDTLKNEIKKSARTSALGKSFYNFLIINKVCDLKTGQPISITDAQIDHIFPKSRYGNQSDNIFNMTLMDKKTNQEKKDKLPSEFFRDCLEYHNGNLESLLKILDKHFINKEAYDKLINNDFENFINLRLNYFLEKLKTDELFKKL